MSGKIFFTVFTPIYNRKHTIHRVWDSLNSQTSKNFEWLIVNDGSEDDIEPLLEKYRKEATFSVRIFHQQNSGKHIAFNKAIDEAKGVLLIPADSDDAFAPNTIATFEKYWNIYGDKSVSGINVLCINEDNDIVGDKYPYEGVTTYKEMFFKNKVKGEKWGCIRVDLLRDHKFPAIKGAHFFPESYIWSQLGFKYNVACFNEPLRIYFQDAGNQLMKDKSFSKGKLMVANYYAIWWVNNVLPELREYLSIAEILQWFLKIWKSSILLKRSPMGVLNEINSFLSKLVLAFLYIPAYLWIKFSKK